MTFLVRARFEGDLEQLREVIPELGPTSGPDASRDYPYRALIGMEDLAAGLEQLGKQIDYTNFKGSIRDYARASIYEQVWSLVRSAARFPLPTKLGKKKR